MTTLKISIDPGSSATKVAYQIAGGSTQCFSMSPYCAEVPIDYPDQTRLDAEAAYPHIESAWVSDPDGCYLLGNGAKKFYGSEVRNHDRKFAKALYKVLGVLSHVQNQEGENYPIEVGVLLPFDEYGTKELLIQNLRLATAALEYCGRSQSLSIADIAIRPEGAGLFLKGLPKTLKVQSAKVAVLVIGHRNASWLVTENGFPVLEESVTNDLGFRWLVQEVRSRTGFKDEMSLAEMIFGGKHFSRDVQAAVDLALPAYWQQISDFLAEQTATDFVVCGGGAALLFKSQLSDFFACRVGWANDLSRSVVRSGIKDKILARRFTDCYGLLLSLGENHG